MLRYLLLSLFCCCVLSGAAPEPKDKPIIDVWSGAYKQPQFSTFTALAQQTLKEKPNAPITIFAPTNEAFLKTFSPNHRRLLFENPSFAATTVVNAHITREHAIERQLIWGNRETIVEVDEGEKAFTLRSFLRDGKACLRGPWYDLRTQENTATVVEPNVVVSDDGVLHGLDRILLNGNQHLCSVDSDCNRNDEYCGPDPNSDSNCDCGEDVCPCYTVCLKTAAICNTFSAPMTLVSQNHREITFDCSGTGNYIHTATCTDRYEGPSAQDVCARDPCTFIGTPAKCPYGHVCNASPGTDPECVCDTNGDFEIDNLGRCVRTPDAACDRGAKFLCPTGPTTYVEVDDCSTECTSDGKTATVPGSFVCGAEITRSCTVDSCDTWTVADNVLIEIDCNPSLPGDAPCRRPKCPTYGNCRVSGAAGPGSSAEAYVVGPLCGKVTATTDVDRGVFATGIYLCGANVGDMEISPTSGAFSNFLAECPAFGTCYVVGQDGAFANGVIVGPQSGNLEFRDTSGTTCHDSGCRNMLVLNVGHDVSVNIPTADDLSWQQVLFVSPNPTGVMLLPDPTDSAFMTSIIEGTNLRMTNPANGAFGTTSNFVCKGGDCSVECGNVGGPCGSQSALICEEGADCYLDCGTNPGCNTKVDCRDPDETCPAGRPFTQTCTGGEDNACVPSSTGRSVTCASAPCDFDCSGSDCASNAFVCPPEGDCSLSCGDGQCSQVTLVGPSVSGDFTLNWAETSARNTQLRCGQYGDCNIHATASGSIGNIQGPIEGDLDIDCSADASCGGTFLVGCPTTNGDCEIECGGDGSCTGSTGRVFNGPMGTNAEMHVVASGANSLSGFTIKCGDKSQCLVECTGTGSCADVVVVCPVDSSNCRVVCHEGACASPPTIVCPGDKYEEDSANFCNPADVLEYPDASTPQPLFQH